MKACPKCQESKLETEFSKNKARWDGLQRICRGCQSAYVRQHYLKNTQYYLDKARRRNDAEVARIRALIRTAKSIPCSDCNQRHPWWVMDFDHVRGKKEFTIGEAIRSRPGRIEAEIPKCDVVCANCHRERTHRRMLERVSKPTG